MQASPPALQKHRNEVLKINQKCGLNNVGRTDEVIE